MPEEEKFEFTEKFGKSDISKFYEDCLESKDDPAEQNGWKNHHAQHSRFTQMSHAIMQLEPGSICDVGCGTGDYLAFLRSNGFGGVYIGLDLSKRMVETALTNYANDKNATFVTKLSSNPVDVTVASGIFNVKGMTAEEDWWRYVQSVIIGMWANSKSGISFNVLSRYSDEVLRKENLYYADPKELVDYCAQKFSSNLILDHSYGQFDMTITVVKRPR